MKCHCCHAVIDQAEADRGAEIVGPGIDTICADCASGWDWGTLMDYDTGEEIGPASREQAEDSASEVASGHHEGVILVNGRSCWVQV